MLIGDVGLQLVFAAPGGVPVMDFSCPGLQWVQEAAVGCGVLFLLYFSLLLARRRPLCYSQPQGWEMSGCAPPGKKAGKEKGGVGIVYAHVWLEQNSSRVLHHSVIFFPVKSPIASLTVNQY